MADLDKSCACYHCNKRKFTKGAIIAHNKSRHSDLMGNLRTVPARTCRDCGTIFATFPDLLEHRAVHQGVDQLIGA